MGLPMYFWAITALLSLSILQQAGDVTAQFTAAPPTCPGDTFTFNCTVGGDMSDITIWRVGGNSECTLVHRSTSSSICGPGDTFTARSGTGFGTSATSFSSTLSGTATSALSGTLVECFGPANNVNLENRVGNSNIQILGPPSVPTLSCVDLSGDVSGTVNVTVSWTLSGGDNAHLYIIGITTNAPEAPYGGLLNVTTASVTLTGFTAGYEFSITVRGVNCGNLEGSASEPLTITPQVPAVPSSCNITLSYDQSSRRLLSINNTWDTVPNPADPDLGNACPGPSGDITQYQIRFQTGSVVATENVNVARCTVGRCNHTFELPSNPPSSYDSVSVTAENVVGVGAARNCTAQTISTFNNLLTGRIVDASSLNNLTIICIFLSGFTGSARCTVRYGTDPTYMNLPYSAESTETGTAGNTVSVVLRERLNSSTVYYYTVSAVSGDVTAVVQATFTTLHYRCSPTDLASTDVVRQCADRGFSVNTMTIPSGVVCQSRTTTESQAVYICDNDDGAATRVCQNYWIWNGSIPQCSPNPGVQNATVQSLTTGATVGIAVAITAVLTFIAGVLCGILLNHCVKKYQCQNSKPESSFYKEQQPAFHQLPQSVSNPLPQTGPEYEEVVKLRKNVSYELTKTGIEMKANESYQSTQQ